MDPRIEKLAAVMADYSLKLKKGDWVKILGHPHAMPLIKAFYKKAIDAGAHPFYEASVDDLQEIFFKYGTDEQLQYISETARLEVEKIDKVLGIIGQSNTKNLSNVDPARQALAQSAQKDIMNRFLEQMIGMDEGASYVGEFAIGTNNNITKFTKNILFDEKIGGTIHLALGASLPETGGKNESALHWDMVCDMRAGGEIYGDGVLIYRDGKFLNTFS